VIWILLALLTVFGGSVAAGVAISGRIKRQLRAGTGSIVPKALPAAGEDKLLERGVRDLRVDDVLTIDGRDFVCEGLISYDEDGHRWSGARVVDGADVRWLVVGVERVGAGALRMLTQDESQQLAGYPPEALVIDDVRYVLDKRGAATCKLEGDLGPLADLKKNRPAGHVERCRWWLYGAPGDATLLVEQWGADYRVLRGAKIGDGTIELIPGS
jgi:hypothetical protein